MLSVIWTSPDAAEVCFLIGFICAAVAAVVALLARSVEIALIAAGIAFAALGLLAL
jgi:hypothetical protein